MISSTKAMRFHAGSTARDVRPVPTGLRMPRATVWSRVVGPVGTGPTLSLETLFGEQRQFSGLALIFFGPKVQSFA